MSLETYPQQNPKAALTFELLCLRCGSAIKPGRKFCSQCGAAANPVPNSPQTGFAGRVNVCPECGFENHRSDRFCKACAGLLVDIRAGAPARDTDVAGRASEEPASGVSVEALPPPDLSPEPLSGQDAVAASVAAPGSESFSVPVSASAVQEVPFHLQGASSGRLRLRALSLASLAIVLITGAVLLYSYHPAGKGKKPASMSSSLAATTSPPSAVEAGNASAANEAVSRLSRTARKAAAPARAENKPHSGPKVQEIAKANIPEPNPSDSSGPPLPKMTPAETSSSVRAPEPLPLAAVSAGMPPALSLKVTSDAAASASGVNARSTPSAPPTVAANIAASITPAGVPSPAKPAVSVTSGVSSAAKSAAPADVAPLRVGGNVQAGKILSQPAPVYPAAAIAVGIQGTVHLDAVIAKDGTVRDLKVVSGNPLLVGAAVYAVRRWRYRPTELDGEPVEVRTDINVQFQLQ